MTYMIDVIFIAIVIFVIVSSSRKGFVSTLLDTFSTVISAVASYLLCNPVAEKFYEMFVHDLVRTRFLRVLDDINSGSAITEKAQAMIEGLPPMSVKLAEAAGLNMNSVISAISSGGNLTNEQLADYAVDKIGYDIMITIIEILVFIVLFIVIALLVRFISKFFENVNKIPFLGKINSLLGGVIGVAKAVIILFFACTVVFFIVSASDPNPLVDAINGSKIYMFVTENNPVMDLIK